MSYISGAKIDVHSLVGEVKKIEKTAKKEIAKQIISVTSDKNI